MPDGAKVNEEFQVGDVVLDELSGKTARIRRLITAGVNRDRPAGVALTMPDGSEQVRALHYIRKAVQS